MIRDGLTRNLEVRKKKQEMIDLEVNEQKFNEEIPGELVFSDKNQTL